MPLATHHWFCDESHLAPHAFRVQGGLWVPDSGLRVVRAEFAKLREKHPRIGELGWTGISGSSLYTVHRDLATLFFESAAAPYLAFTCIVIARDEDPSANLDAAGRDLGFYKAYWLLLRHRMSADRNNVVRLDEKTSPSKSPHAKLQEALNKRLAEQGPGRVTSCLPEKSNREDLLQLADVLCGAVGWAWNGSSGGRTSGAKFEMGSLLAQGLGRAAWRPFETAKHTPKFNVWRYRPKRT